MIKFRLLLFYNMFRALLDHLQVYLYIGPVVNCHVSPTLASVYRVGLVFFVLTYCIVK
jgi:hypothetical protein